MKELRNLILLDSAPQKEWNFQQLFEKKTGQEWKIAHIDSHFSDPGWKKKLKFFLFPAQVFLQRDRIGAILSFQQFYGLIFALYCSIFHVKKRNTLLIVTFIYRPKKGIAGRLYFHFMKYAVRSRYIDRIICFSKTEPEYYSRLFGVRKELFAYVPFAIGDVSPVIKTAGSSEEKFILSAGKSNRDYDFLVDALAETAYPVRIISDTYKREEVSGNIRIYGTVYGRDYLKMLAECYCVVVPLADVHISAGQFVFLQSMMFGKPVIVTESETVRDYIEDGSNGLIIKKEKNCLLDALKKLYEDKGLYKAISDAGKEAYKKEYSLEGMAERIGDIYMESLQA